MSVTFYHYKGCSSSRKARKWLDERGVEYEAVDLVETPPSAEVLRDLWQRSGQPLRKFFNTSGQSYRQGGFKDRLKTLSDDEALAALAADGKLVKRPLLDGGAWVLIGFKPAQYEERLGGA